MYQVMGRGENIPKSFVVYTEVFWPLLFKTKQNKNNIENTQEKKPNQKSTAEYESWKDFLAKEPPSELNRNATDDHLLKNSTLFSLMCWKFIFCAKDKHQKEQLCCFAESWIERCLNESENKRYSSHTSLGNVSNDESK